MADDPRLPTAHGPGSPEKVEVLRRRAARGLPLFVEGDAPGGHFPARPVSKKRGRVEPETWAKVAALQVLRKRGLTVRQAAKALGCSLGYISYLLKLGRRVPA